MRWPFSKRVEHRQGYGDEVVALLLSQAQGGLSGDYRELAGVQAASALIGRCLAMGDAEPNVTALTPSLLYDIGHALTVDGEYVAKISMDAEGNVTLIRAADWDVQGDDPDPTTWGYRLNLPAPSGTRTEYISQAGVVHFKINVQRNAPHKGRSSVALAASSGTFAATLEKSQTLEASAPTGHVLPFPGDQIEGDDLAELKNDLRNLKGRTALVPSMRGDFSGPISGNGASFSGDWRSSRIGYTPLPAIEAVRQDLFDAVVACCGVPVGLLAGGRGGNNGGALREALRAFLHTTLSPLGRIVAQEVTEKMGEAVSFSFDSLFAADVQGRARAFKSLIDGGMAIEAASALVGLGE